MRLCGWWGGPWWGGVETVVVRQAKKFGKFGYAKKKRKHKAHKEKFTKRIITRFKLNTLHPKKLTSFASFKICMLCGHKE